MAAGISVVVFPEGTRSPDGRPLPFKRGGFLLAIKTKKPIVPVTIDGSGRILPKGAWGIRGGKIKVTVGKPLIVDKYRPGTLKALSTALHDVISQDLGIDASVSQETANVTQVAGARAPAKMA
jgi:1-acyl-sn-glycerol-3-phosphate acyltransferase